MALIKKMHFSTKRFFWHKSGLFLHKKWIFSGIAGTLACLAGLLAHRKLSGTHLL
jgi:hypothetical protein